jgi:uncharacterized protein (DUF2236 family)
MVTRGGFFSPHTVFWNVNRELLLGLAGTRALLMELAHPLIAAGVAQHSQFGQYPVRRLYRTMRMMTRLTFGSRQSAARALRHIHECHRPVHGNVGQTIACPRGSYDANDPQLKLWVLATLTDSSLRLYDSFIRPLSDAGKEAYYQDSLRMGQLLGIPLEQMPADFAAFSRYVEDMINGEILAVGNHARQVVEALFAPTALGRLAKFSSYVSVGLLPERLRLAYELPWGAEDERRLRRLAAFSRKLRACLPDFVCVNPQAWFAGVVSRPAIRSALPIRDARSRP